MAVASPLRFLPLVVLVFCWPGRGESGCADCHPKQTTHFSGTAMARALLAPNNTAVLIGNEPLTFQDGLYSYVISREAGAPTYRVTDGQTAISAPILWSFGAGSAGQTYIYAREGKLFESRVSYYTAIKGLDLTIGAPGSIPASLEMAAGRKMQDQDVAECFGCHSTSGGKGTGFDLAKMRPGVQCGACHSGLEKHQVPEAAAWVPASLGKLSTEEISNLCGQCHRTWEQISINGPRGIANVRFQPYRLTNSKCYDAEDLRIRCTACHDPHIPLETRAEAYDRRCTSCHSRGSSSTAASHLCKTATSACTGCHMPKYEIPGSHMIFSDHHIRIVRNKEDYPN